VQIHVAIIDRLVHHVLADAFQPQVLQPFLYDTDIDIRQRARAEIIHVADRLHQQWRIQHLVIGKRISHHGAKACQRVCENGQRFAGIVEDAVLQPVAAAAIDHKKATSHGAVPSTPSSRTR
jgi:hypothetical protein